MQNYKQTDTILLVKDLTVGYNGKTILKDINIEEKDIVRDGHQSTGQTIAFLGRSGRGKSTIFKALTGLINPNTGKILIKDIGGKESNDAKIVSEGDVGFVDQKYTLFRHKNIEEICMYALRKSKLTKEEKKQVIDHYFWWSTSTYCHN
jgi:polar amino acid transport system ATP-binding protein